MTSVRLNVWIACAISCLLFGCQSHYFTDDLSAFTRSTVDGLVHRHTVFYPEKFGFSDELHIYLGGDGEPWLGPKKIAADPTPQTELALELMLADSSPSVFLARPCYYLDALSFEQHGCEPMLWTAGRYSKYVVESTIVAVNNLVQRHKVKRVTLVGYSGGGSLAVLVANSIEQLDTVVTVAANLDTLAWVEFHSYSPLSESLNPRDVEIHVGVKQWHFYGARDKNTPAELFDSFFTLNDSQATLFESYSHDCCWVEAWPEILKRF